MLTISEEFGKWFETIPKIAFCEHTKAISAIKSESSL